MTETAERTRRREDTLRKVRALLDTADSHERTGNDAAAHSYRVKADQLMAVYAIQEFELSMAQPAHAREKPEFREYEYGATGDAMFDHSLSTIFYSVARFCDVKIGWYGYSSSKVVGYSGDLDYMDLLFTSIRMHLAGNILPRPQAHQSYEENLAMLKEAGMKWARIYPLMVQAHPERFVGTVADATKSFKGDGYSGGLADRKARHEEHYPDTPWEESPMFTSNYFRVGDHVFRKEIPRPIGVRFTKEYTDFCKANDRERVYGDPTVYRRSFLTAFTYRLSVRLEDIKSERKDATTGKEVVLASREGDLQEFFYEAFPDKRPHPPECDCDYCHRCADKKCQRPRCRAARQPIRYRQMRETATSIQGSRAGNQAANSADISGRDRRMGGGKSKELG